MIPLVLLAALSGTADAKAFPAPEMMGAFEGNLRSGYAFVSVMSPTVDRRITPVAQVTASYLYYHFEEVGGEASVLSPGLGLGLGLSWRPERVSLTVMAGYEARYVETTPSTGVTLARADHGVLLNASVYYTATTKIALAGNVSYGFAQNYLWARVLAKHQLLPVRGTAVTKFSMGIDGTIHGNDDARGVDGGVFGELGFPGASTAITLRVGLGREIQPGATDALQPSLGVSVYKAF